MDRWTVRTIWLVGSLVAAWTPILCAQTVDLKAGSRNVYLREAVELRLEVTNFQSCEPPPTPDIPGAVLRQLGDSSEMTQATIVNGRLTQSHTRTYTYELTPQRVGELVVPPIAVQAR